MHIKVLVIPGPSGETGDNRPAISDKPRGDAKNAGCRCPRLR